MRKCCVPNCQLQKAKNFKDDGKKSVLFPKDEILKQTWLKSLGLSNVTLHRSSRVCEDHFETSSIQISSFKTTIGSEEKSIVRAKRLIPGSIPCITIEKSIVYALTIQVQDM